MTLFPALLLVHLLRRTALAQTMGSVAKADRGHCRAACPLAFGFRAAGAVQAFAIVARDGDSSGPFVSAGGAGAGPAAADLHSDARDSAVPDRGAAVFFDARRPAVAASSRFRAD